MKTKTYEHEGGRVVCMCVHVEKQPPEVFYKKNFLKYFAKFTGKQAPGLRRATLLKKRLQHRCSLVNFAKFFRTPILQNTSGRLLLYVIGSCYFYETEMFRHSLSVLTGKKQRQIKLKCLRKVRIWPFGFLIHQINSL